MMQQFILKEKKQLTHDVFELIFESENELTLKAGQFVTFILDKIGGRAYSVLELDGKKISFIIKKRETENGGRGGSAYICNLKVGDVIKGVGPAGHFVLKENNNNKLFIGTGTGLVPLYNQILGSIDQNQDCKLTLIFGVRTEKDLFYLEKFEEIKKKYSKFDFIIYLSKEETEIHKKGYVTDFITPKIINTFKEYYICGAPAMIDSTVEKLKKTGANEENIFLERY